MNSATIAAKENQLASQFLKILPRSKPEIHSNFEDKVKLSLPYGHSLELTCTVYGTPTPVLKWFRNGEEIENSSTIFMENFNLIFDRLEKEDRGNYSCKAENELGTDQKTLEIEAEGADKKQYL